MDNSKKIELENNLEFTKSNNTGAKVEQTVKPSPVLAKLEKKMQRQDEFLNIQKDDYEWKVKARKNYGKILLGLLIVQNLAVFILVFWAFISGNLDDLQVIFSILIPATLGETAYMVKTIVEWLFKDINYPT